MISVSSSTSSALAWPWRRYRLSVQIALELGGGVVEPAERAAGDGLSVEQPDEQPAAGRRELCGRISAQPLRDSRLGAAVPGGVLDSQLGQQRLGQRIILADRHETKLDSQQAPDIT